MHMPESWGRTWAVPSSDTKSCTQFPLKAVFLQDGKTPSLSVSFTFTHTMDKAYVRNKAAVAIDADMLHSQQIGPLGH